MEFVLITTVSNQGGKTALCVAPLTTAFLDALDNLLVQHGEANSRISDLVQFRVNRTHGLRLVHDGPLFHELEEELDEAPSGIVVRPLLHRHLDHYADLPTQFLDLIVYDTCIHLLGHVGHGDDEYLSSALEPPALRELLREAQTQPPPTEEE